MIDITDAHRAKLRTLRLSTFADIYFELLNDEAYEDRLPEEIFFAAVDQALEARRQRLVDKAIAAAGFTYPQASIAEIINPEARGMSERQIKRLAATNWREHPSNLHIYAPTGTGKTYLACAIGIEACHAGYSVAYFRLDQLVAKLAAYSPSDDQYEAMMRKLTNVDVLIIDDFCTISVDLRGQEDLTKIVIERDGRLPTIICSQSTAAYWVKVFPSRIGAESLVSRLNNGRQLKIGDFDMRKHLAKQAAAAQDSDYPPPQPHINTKRRPRHTRVVGACQYHKPGNRQYRLTGTAVPPTRSWQPPRTS
ncbi:DNA replication protein [Corynebacterium camporealensis]|uniref:DNA replication protein n=1 Tax=Corynebacterium camporealensis TaxID=161896 RepID=A0A0F6QZQ1_9CORY|nr:ATP-binding protein [Corynebacterium camporealensis]AKE39963.1 DNA replication protein [Corynebacterium camporealensis]